MVRNGKAIVNIKGKTTLGSFRRQVLKETKLNRNKQVIPINTFFPQLRQGKAIVSKNLEKQAIESCLELSYRSSEKSIQNKLGRESIRRLVISKGKKAARLEKFPMGSIEKIEEENEVVEAKKKTNAEIKPKNKQSNNSQTGSKVQDNYLENQDAESSESNYKNTQKEKGRMRKLFGFIFQRRVLYLMADGVGVQLQGDAGTRECKVGACFMQKGEGLKQIACFCTWKRINAFRQTLHYLLLRIFFLSSSVVIISDGARWIRNLRKRIPCLKRAKWILDWFHLYNRVINLMIKLDLEPETEQAKHILSLYWFGRSKEALSAINNIPLSSDLEIAKEQKEVIRKHKTYIHNQREGIINYQAFKMKGYLVGSGAIEKINDLLIKNRMVRQKRMQWGLEGGESMMQLLAAKWNGRLDEVFVLS